MYRRGCVLLANPPHARYIGGNGRSYPKVGPNHSLGYEFKLGANWLWGSVVQPSGYAVTHPVSTMKAIVGSTVSDFTHCNIRYLMTIHCGVAAFDIASLFPVAAFGRVAKTANELRDVRLAELAVIGRYDLATAERSGGHTLARHVGRSEQDLIDRNIPYASTFTDQNTAERATAHNLSANASKIERWLEGKSPRLAIREPMSSISGKIYDRSTKTFIEPRGVLTVLVRTPTGFTVLTSYPTP